LNRSLRSHDERPRSQKGLIRFSFFPVRGRGRQRPSGSRVDRRPPGARGLDAWERTNGASDVTTRGDKDKAAVCGVPPAVLRGSSVSGSKLNDQILATGKASRGVDAISHTSVLALSRRRPMSGEDRFINVLRLRYEAPPGIDTLSALAAFSARVSVLIKRFLAPICDWP
jgi:hypothetical protein